jgi:hypothetical protein
MTMTTGAMGATIRAGRAALAGGVFAALLLLAAAASARAATLPTPTITTVASGTVAVGGSLSDTAVLTGGASPQPGGTVTFSLYDVTDTKCAGTPVYTHTAATVVPNVSGSFTAAKVGTYSWIASYSGDSANAKAEGKCGDPGETVSVTAAKPTITTVASPSVGLGGTVNDTAVLTGAYKPTGTVTFKLYGAADPTCAAPPVFTSTVPVATPAVSGGYAPTAVGTYRFVAAYGGDAANTAAANGCGDPAESVVVTAVQKAAPPAAPKCDSAGMAHALSSSLVAALTGGSGAAFKAACSAGVRIVLRAKEIRPGNAGFPHHDGFTTIGNTLTHTTAAGQVAFSFNAQGDALRTYARSTGTTLVVFAIVHVRPDGSSQSSESIAIFGLR